MPDEVFTIWDAELINITEKCEGEEPGPELETI